MTDPPPMDETNGDPGRPDPDEIGCLLALGCPVLALAAVVAADLAPMPDLPGRWTWAGGAVTTACLSVGVFGPGAAMFLTRGSVRWRLLAACLASVLGAIVMGTGLALYTFVSLAASG